MENQSSVAILESEINSPCVVVSVVLSLFAVIKDSMLNIKCYESCLAN